MSGLHLANVEGLIGVMRDLLVDGESVVFVDHDVQALPSLRGRMSSPRLAFAASWPLC